MCVVKRGLLLSLNFLSAILFFLVQESSCFNSGCVKGPLLLLLSFRMFFVQRFILLHLFSSLLLWRDRMRTI